SILVFTLMRLTPVDPVDMMLLNLRTQGGLPAGDLAALRARYAAELGLDKPIPVQYVIWLWEILSKGTLGFSFTTGRPALSMLLERVPPTLILMSSALVISLVVGGPLGIRAALRRNRIS